MIMMVVCFSVLLIVVSGKLYYNLTTCEECVEKDYLWTAELCSTLCYVDVASCYKKDGSNDGDCTDYRRDQKNEKTCDDLQAKDCTVCLEQQMCRWVKYSKGYQPYCTYHISRMMPHEWMVEQNSDLQCSDPIVTGQSTAGAVGVSIYVSSVTGNVFLFMFLLSLAQQ